MLKFHSLEIATLLVLLTIYNFKTGPDQVDQSFCVHFHENSYSFVPLPLSQLNDMIDTPAHYSHSLAGRHLFLYKSKWFYLQQVLSFKCQPACPEKLDLSRYILLFQFDDHPDFPLDDFLLASSLTTFCCTKSCSVHLWQCPTSRTNSIRSWSNKLRCFGFWHFSEGKIPVIFFSLHELQHLRWLSYLMFGHCIGLIQFSLHKVPAGITSVLHPNLQHSWALFTILSLEQYTSSFMGLQLLKVSASHVLSLCSVETHRTCPLHAPKLISIIMCQNTSNTQHFQNFFGNVLVTCRFHQRERKNSSNSAVLIVL